MNLISVSQKVILCSNHVTGNQEREIDRPSEVILYTSCCYSIKPNCLVANHYGALITYEDQVKSIISCHSANDPLTWPCLTVQFSSFPTEAHSQSSSRQSQDSNSVLM